MRDKRNFDCAKCTPHVKKTRRCQEDRWNFDSSDGAVFPISVTKGGRTFGFCPGKATWDLEAIDLFQILVVCCEMKKLPYSGGVAEQPHWFIELIAWFVVQWDDTKFYNRAKSILGDSTKAAKNYPEKGRRHGSYKR